MRRVLNRVLLALVGLLMLVGGSAAAARSRGGFHGRLGDALGTAHKPLITPSQTERLTEHGWWWWVAFGLPGVVLAVCVGWFLAQSRRRLVKALRVADAVTVDGHALAHAVEDDVRRIPDVISAQARLVRRRHGPQLKLAVRAEAGAHPYAVLRAVRDEAVEHGRTSVGLERLPVDVEFRTVRGLPRRHLH
ncbi:alkaline shock response membrane anchor protein AmaP [Yinghuangia soli]|uniref:Alkaline shock response membrane anchor protein AmaP n=1 Tax=Yinghuangia soli TaxID=2908204 RepID=A0AA41PXL1_9ACTN|nr:alkaline shock response membrane anchor protein AmaP [Yinghuangia soli]MCF2527225.1 alkaline shock response membrane anchor protein AmaP [Yinghuangia soli]